MTNNDGTTPQKAAIDVHCHFVSNELLMADDRLQVATVDGGDELFFGSRQLGPLPPELTTLSLLREDMERAHLTGRLLCTASWLTFYWLDAPAAGRLIRSTNEGLASAAQEDPEHLLALASVPLQDVDAAIDEVEYAASELRVAGLAIGTNVKGVYYDDERFDPFFEAVQDLGLPIFFHPDNVGGRTAMEGYALRWLLGNPQEVTTLLTRVLLGGVLERFPRLALCFPLGGGGIAQVIGRLDHGWHAREHARSRSTVPPSTLLRRCYVDSIVHSEAALAQVLSVMSPDNVLLGSDWPWDMGTRDPRAPVDGSTGLTAEEKTAVLSRNVERILGRAPRPTTV